MTTKKVYVDVGAWFSKTGQIKPEIIIFENDRKFHIDKILDSRRAASLKAGGVGMRYTIRIGSKETYLFLEENRWFVEAENT